MTIEFTYKGYRNILEHALENEYKFILFEEKDNFPESRTCLLRHDIDCDLGAAYELSCIEKELEIKSTFFIMMRSPLYNPFGRENNELIQKMLQNGSCVSLHYDEGFYPFFNVELEELIRREIEVFRLMFGVEIKCISFHQPSAKILQNEIKLKGIINTYDKQDMKGYHYLSDSNMKLRESPFDLFSSGLHQRIQLLIHPVWWVSHEPGKNTFDFWDKAILENFERAQRQIHSVEAAYGCKRQFLLTRLENETHQK